MGPLASLGLPDACQGISGLDHWLPPCAPYSKSQESHSYPITRVLLQLQSLLS